MIDESKQGRRGYSGTITHASLHDVIQLICMGRKTCRMRVKSGTKDGTIYFADGEIVHAEQNSDVGEQAFFNILSWELGAFDCDEAQIPNRTIEESWDFLLMESVRRIDSA